MTCLHHQPFFERPDLWRVAVTLASILLLWLTPGVALAQATSAAIIEAGAKTRGGLVAGMRVIHVTSLADDGAGSLRAALAGRGPRVIVFDVAGVINLESDLRVSSPQVTVAGQTAPAPGVFVRGAKLLIATHDVVVQHLSVFPVATSSLAVKGSIDAISVASCSACQRQVSDVRLENITAGWSTDEIIGLWGDGLSRITIRSSILAEALDQAGHHKVHHSMGLLIGAKVEGVAVVGNLFANNKWRNPVVGAGATAYIANNFVYNPGKAALHLYGDRSARITRASFIGNVVKRGPSTESREMAAVRLPTVYKQPSRGALVFAQDNHCCSGRADAGNSESGGATSLVDTLPVISNSWKLLAADHVLSWVFDHAGSRPRQRGAFDTRVLTHVAEGTGRIINNATEVGGYPNVTERSRRALVPADPFAPAGSGLRARTRLEGWLCLRHLEVGGPQTPECPDDKATLRAALGNAQRAKFMDGR